MKNAVLILALLFSAATAYFANRAVDSTAATHDAQRLALINAGAMEHFKGLSEEAVKLLAKEMERTAMLERYIEANGLPVPGRLSLPAEPTDKAIKDLM